MKKQFRIAASVMIVISLSLAVAFAANTAVTSSAPSNQKEKVMTTHASGAFDVKIVPQSEDPVPGATIGRMALDKQFHGDLQATSLGQMLAIMSDVKGSAGYVAMERVTGKLHGRSGSFALQHNGLMNRGAPTLSVTVVPDSATGELVGLAGTMQINIIDGKHFYEFDYTLADSP